MAVRTAYDAVAGTILTATNLDRYPGGWIGYVEITANQTGISGQVDITSLTVTVTAGTTRRLLAEGYVRVTQQTTAAIDEVILLENGVAVNKTSLTRSASDTGMHQPRAVRTPSSGSNTYKLAGSVASGTIDIIATSAQPGFILVQDIGPA
jgi:hypothetical protein